VIKLFINKNGYGCNFATRQFETSRSRKIFLCMQDMDGKIMSAVLFVITFLKVCTFQHTCAVFSTIAIYLALMYHGHLL